MFSSSLYATLALSKTTSPQKLFPSDCVTLYVKENLLGSLLWRFWILGVIEKYTYLKKYSK